MQGVLIKDGMKICLNIEGQSWTQGEEVKTQISFSQSNIENYNLAKSNFKVSLIKADLKKVKEKNSKSFVTIHTATLGELIQTSDDDNDNNPTYLFDLTLKEDCLISDTKSSLYLNLCNDPANPFEGILLKLNVFPHKIISSFIQIFENFFRFKVKTFKNKNKDRFIEAKVLVPDTKQFTSVLKLNLQIKMNESVLEVKFCFALKKITFDQGIMSTKDHLLEIKKDLKITDYQYGKDAPNQEKICSIIKDVIEQIKLKPII